MSESSPVAAPVRSLQPTLKFDGSPGSALKSSRTLKLSPEDLKAYFGHSPSSAPPPPALPAPALLPSAPPTVASLPPSAALPALARRRRSLVAAGSFVGALALGIAAYAGVQAASSNTRWVAPTVLSSSDPRVAQVAATIQQETSRRSDLLLQKKELETRLEEAKNEVELEESFQASFKAALSADLAGQRTELHRLETLLAWRDASKEGTAAVPFGADLDSKVTATRRRIQLLAAAAHDGRAGARYDALALRRELDRSLVASSKARSLEAALAQALSDIDPVLAQKTALLASLDASPYSLAIGGDVTLGFVPYDNVAQVRVGDALVACKASHFFCHPVGAVGGLLSGEVRGTNPMGGPETRGRLVRLILTEPRSAEHPMLFTRDASQTPRTVGAPS